ncbi:MAG TPA: CGNR zinc finger domain-containing protein [Candidatus Dormibacteraeota bacterium]
MAASRNRAPGDLDLVRRFINTADLEQHSDEIATPAQLEDWLRGAGLGPEPVDEAGHRRALALREALRSLALANNAGQAYPVDLATLNRAAVECRLRPRFTSAGAARLEPEAEGLDRALGRLVAAVYEAMAGGTWNRLKACRKHSCRWAFYDSSRNHSATWCNMAVCGNREKAERFRRRQSNLS